MGLVTFSLPMTKYLVKAGVLEKCPFTLLDVGCSGGIFDIWRVFDKYLISHGIDPQQSEVDRLNENESHEGIHYHAFYVGLPDTHEYCIERSKTNIPEYFQPWQRLSAAAFNETSSSEAPPQNNPIGEDLTSKKITIAEFVKENSIASVDFIKIDTDGFDLEALHSCEDVWESRNVLGALIETSYVGGPNPTDNTFHNIDRFMKSRGFQIFNMDIKRYSRKVLPAPFKLDIYAQTHWGQPQWGDVLYLRDGAAKDYEKVWKNQLSVEKILKLACLYEMYQVPDCAIEMFLEHKKRLEQYVNVDELIEVLTPPLRGKQVSYSQYMNAFYKNTKMFFPSYEEEK